MRKIIYITIGIITIIIGIIIIKISISDKNNEECYSITGGGYNIHFNTNSNIILDSVHVCIACPPNTYTELPIIEKEGYIFDGWYYDSDLTEKVNASTTLDVKLNPIYKNKECIVGYNDITLHAKWNTIDTN